jgi:hypothetical protein
VSDSACTVVLVGAGFDSGITIVLEIGSVDLGTFNTANANGFQETVTIPASSINAPGSYTIVATGSNGQTATYTLTVTGGGSPQARSIVVGSAAAAASSSGTGTSSGGSSPAAPAASVLAPKAAAAAPKVATSAVHALAPVLRVAQHSESLAAPKSASFESASGGMPSWILAFIAGALGLSGMVILKGRRKVRTQH